MRLALLPAFLATCVSLFAAPPLPRKSPELTIAGPTVKSTPLSSYRGKVVVLEFLNTTCSHCQYAAGMLSKLQTDLGPKGFQAIGVAFVNSSPDEVKSFIQQFKPNFPIGVTSIQAVVNYMAWSPDDRPSTPQMVVIDRKVMIRAQSPPEGDPQLQDEKYLRAFIGKLLNESVPTPAKKAAPVAAKN